MSPHSSRPGACRGVAAHVPLASGLSSPLPQPPYERDERALTADALQTMLLRALLRGRAAAPARPAAAGLIEVCIVFSALRSRCVPLHDGC